MYFCIYICMRIIVANMKATFNQFTANDHPSCLTFSASAKKEIFYNLRLYVHVSEYLFNLFVIYLVFCVFLLKCCCRQRLRHMYVCMYDLYLYYTYAYFIYFVV